MEDNEEVEVIIVTLLLFPWPTLSVTSHLAPVGVHIPGLKQFREPIVMTPVIVATEPTPIRIPKPTVITEVVVTS